MKVQALINGNLFYYDAAIVATVSLETAKRRNPFYKDYELIGTSNILYINDVPKTYDQPIYFLKAPVK